MGAVDEDVEKAREEARERVRRANERESRRIHRKERARARAKAKGRMSPQRVKAIKARVTTTSRGERASQRRRVTTIGTAAKDMIVGTADLTIITHRCEVAVVANPATVGTLITVL